jgi:S1-C subfamily serine protease
VSGSLLDLVLVAAALGFALSGWRRGFLVGVLSLVGLVGGGLLGAEVAGAIWERSQIPVPRTVVGILSVVVGAVVGQAVAVALGSVLRGRLRTSGARAADGAGGAAVSVVSLLLVAWLVATAVDASPYRRAAEAVHSSRVLAVVDAAVPHEAAGLAATLRQLVDTAVFPEVFGGLRPPSLAPAPPPDPALAGSPAVRAARASVVRVFGDRVGCAAGSTGSGFVVAPERVMTNAHVVAGVDDPQVELDGRTHEASTVYFDPGLDVAVLAVPDLAAPALPFAEPAQRGADAVVVGHPGGGPFTAVSARVRQELDARGFDIYGAGSVDREVYAVSADVRPGNSGGPLLDTDGEVYGVVFAAAADQPGVGYALTAQAVAPAVAAAGATRVVATGPCLAG